MAGLFAKIKEWFAPLPEYTSEEGQEFNESNMPPEEEDVPRESISISGEDEQAAGCGHIVPAELPDEKIQSLERVQESFNRLIDQLQGINEHLNQHVRQQRDLAERMDRIPTLLESVPGMVADQHKTTEEVLRHLRQSQGINEEFIELVRELPRETAKQTESANQISHTLSSMAQNDTAMRDAFGAFSETVRKLNTATEANRYGLMSMEKTFAASDRHMKYLVSVQNRRFVWLFVGMMLFGIVAIGALVAMIMLRPWA